ncbi:hypothetical protein WA577_002777 [Blastocystis sp. JDR]
MILAMCDAHTSNLNISGEVITINPHGHISARLYGSIPFTQCLLVAYSLLLLLWSLCCLRYFHQLMSVHALITLVLVSFSADTLLHLLALTAYNRTGLPAPVATLSLLTTTLTHTLARGLLLTLAMGAGVTRASLGPATCRVLLACLLDLFVTLWDAFASAFAPARSAAIHTIPAGIANAALYGWAFAALFRTLRELEEKKQTSKLQLFLRLRNVLCGGVLVAAAYTAAFGVATVRGAEGLWRIQWFCEDGVWALFFFLTLCCIAWLWAPNEHSLEYAYHVQVATDERTGSELVSVQDDLIQGGEEEAGVMVSTVQGGVESLKPMKM